MVVLYANRVFHYLDKYQKHYLNSEAIIRILNSNNFVPTNKVIYKLKIEFKHISLLDKTLNCPCDIIIDHI